VPDHQHVCVLSRFSFCSPILPAQSNRLNIEQEYSLGNERFVDTLRCSFSFLCPLFLASRAKANLRPMPMTIDLLVLGSNSGSDT
jgi:hypothetical protein